MACRFKGSVARSRSWLTTERASGSSFIVEDDEFIFYAVHVDKIFLSSLQCSRNLHPAAPLGPHRRWGRGTQSRVAGSAMTNDQADFWSLEARTLAGKGSTGSPSWPNHLRQFCLPIGWGHSKARIKYPIRNCLLRLKRSLVTKGNIQSVKPEDPMRTRKEWIGPNDSPSIKR